MAPRGLLGVAAVACLLLVCSVEAVQDTQELSADLERAPPGANDMSLGEAEEEDSESPEQDQDETLREKQDEEEVHLEAKTGRGTEQELGESDGPATEGTQPAAAKQQASDSEGDSEHEEASASEATESDDKRESPESGKFSSNVFVTAGKSTLRVGEAWGMPGVYSSDGGARDLILGTAGGKKIYFGTAKNDAWIEATTGHMWLKGSITVKNYAHFFAEKQRLRVGAAWGMPGIYASDGADRDMIIGTAAGKKIYFGVHRQDAWIEAGEGHMWLKGSLTVKNYGHFLADGQRLRVGAVFGMPGLYASDGGNRDMLIGTAAGKKIFFGVKNEDAFIEAGSGNMFLKGGLEANENSQFKADGKTLQVGSSYKMPGIYAGAAGADDLSLGTLSGRRIYFGVDKQDAFIQAGTGNMYLKGALTTDSDLFVVSEKQKLRVGSVHGMPGIFASDGEARDMMLGTDAGRKIYLGKEKSDAWVEAGSGNAFFAGTLSVEKSISVQAMGQNLRVGEYSGMPGIYSSDDGARDLIIGAAKDRKIYVGEGTEDSYFTAGAGSLWLKAGMEAHDNVFIYSEDQRLRVGSVNGIPGIFSSDGAPRDLMLGTAKNSKVYFGDERADAWVQGGTGDSFFKGKMQVTNAISVEHNGQILTVGESFGMPGLFSSEGVARDLMLGTASGKKVHLGYGTGDFSVEGGTGNVEAKGKITAKDLEATGAITGKGAAFFEDTVTVSKNLILAQSGGEMMDLSEEMLAMRAENAELRSMMAEMRDQMSELMQRSA